MEICEISYDYPEELQWSYARKQWLKQQEYARLLRKGEELHYENT